MRYKIFNRKCNKSVVLIHGLFASSGYWLNYLNYFKDYKLAILDLNYETSLDDFFVTNLLEQLIEKEFSNKVDFIFSHSLGTLLANSLPDNLFLYSFEICPVYCSSRINSIDFQNLLLSLSPKNNLEFIRTKLNQADLLIQNHQKRVHHSSKKITFFPDNDEYFKYYNHSGAEARFFDGDHFEIGKAIEDCFETYIFNHTTRIGTT
jgi:hypothetical protein